MPAEQVAQPAPSPPDDLPTRLARIDARLDALEAALSTEPRPADDDLARLAWAVKHGRQRPW